MTNRILNAALSILWAIGGVFQAIIQSKAEAKDIAEFQHKDAKENPPAKRVVQPLRSYNKRYTHILSGVIARKNLETIQKRQKQAVAS